LAKRCAEVVGKPRAVILRPPMIFDAPDRMIGDHEVFYTLMEAHGIKALSLDEQIYATAAYLGLEGVFHR
jgi:hypothetical protein